MENKPFEFFTSVKLLEATGRMARNQKELLTAIREIDEATDIRENILGPWRPRKSSRAGPCRSRQTKPRAGSEGP